MHRHAPSSHTRTKTIPNLHTNLKGTNMIFISPQFKKNFVYAHSAGHFIITMNEASKKWDYLKDIQYS